MSTHTQIHRHTRSHTPRILLGGASPSPTAEPEHSQTSCTWSSALGMQPTCQRQVTPDTPAGILSDSNIRLDERLDLLDFLDEHEGNHEASPAGEKQMLVQPPAGPQRRTSAPAHLCRRTSAPASSGQSSPVGTCVRRAASFPEREYPRHGGAAASAAAPPQPSRPRLLGGRLLRRPPLPPRSSALEVAAAAECLSAQNVIHDEITAASPWCAQAGTATRRLAAALQPTPHRVCSLPHNPGRAPTEAGIYSLSSASCSRASASRRPCDTCAARCRRGSVGGSTSSSPCSIGTRACATRLGLGARTSRLASDASRNRGERAA